MRDSIPKRRMQRSAGSAPGVFLFIASFKTDNDEDTPELARELLELTEGLTFDPVEASVTEHFTTPPKPYTEDICCERGIRNHP